MSHTRADSLVCKTSRLGRGPSKSRFQSSQAAAQISLKRAGSWANGFICGSSAIPEFPTTWEKIAQYARAAGRNPDEIEKAGLTFMAINDITAKAVETLNSYVMRYYGRLRGDVASKYLVGSTAAVAGSIAAI